MNQTDSTLEGDIPEQVLNSPGYSGQSSCGGAFFYQSDT